MVAGLRPAHDHAHQSIYREEPGMSAAPVIDDSLITAEGYERLSSELETLHRVTRRDVSARLREARADGHLDDNPALFEALEEQAQIEHRIALLEDRLAAARIAQPSLDGRAGIGSAIRLRDLETDELIEYELVGAMEGDASLGRVSIDAPMGRSVLGAAAGDVVCVNCPRGELLFEVRSVDAAVPRADVRAAA
jgi:transcription elongation factor GreA